MLKRRSLGSSRAVSNVKAIQPGKRARNLCVAANCSASRTLMNSMLGIAASALLTLSLADVQPATAVDSSSLTQAQLKEAEELYNMIRKRTGQEPPQITSAPNLKGRALLAEVRRQAEASTGAPDAALLSELRAQLDRINQQLKDTTEGERAELERLRQALEEAKAAQQATPAELSSVSVIVPPEVKDGSIGGAGVKGTESEEDTQGGRPAGLLNVLGIFLGGGLGGYLYVQQNKAKTVQENLNVALSEEQKRVDELKKRTDEIRDALGKEEETVSKLKSEMQMAATESSLILAAERRERESSMRANELSLKALEAEKRLVAAVRAQAATAKEEAQAERAAKFVAEAEAQALSRQLKEAQELMEKERTVARKVGMDAMKAMSQSKRMEEALGQAVVTGESLKRSLEVEEQRGNQAEGAAADLQRELADTAESLEEQRNLLKRVGGDTMDMKDAMSKLKQQALQFSVKAQLASDAAKLERKEAALQLKAVTEQLQQAKGQVSEAHAEIEQLKASLVSRESQVDSLEAELKLQQQNNKQLMEQVAHLQTQLSEVEQSLTAEQSTSKELRQQLQAAQSSLNASQSSLEATSRELRLEQGARAALQSDVMKLKQELSNAAAAVENERLMAARAKTDAENAEQRVTEANAATAAMKDEFSKSSEKFSQRLAEALSKAWSAETDRAKAEEELHVLTSVLSDTQASLKNMEAKAAELQGQGKALEEARALEVGAAQQKIVELEKMLETAQAGVQQAREGAAEAEARVASEMAAVREDAEMKAALAAAELEAERMARSEVEASLRLLQSQMTVKKETPPPGTASRLAKRRQQSVDVTDRKAVTAVESQHGTDEKVILDRDNAEVAAAAAQASAQDSVISPKSLSGKGASASSSRDKKGFGSKQTGIN
ncbi:hypothetical protein CEUSTIGMA_g6392.t1 [Chlamydomonas eustigma]|uniref:Uncharacterized protein n=1 Tax=Chlamydomonas eustigma TaxID=1157962 RepID=A0A250X7U4_9CHLO|nr:hypothetical protein CEUSTIGMA_g6392.t1 [Chlamydomonas eustigma]|eukprot:GAX78952.1 hypothetical protein CEUSTIGMA_g6392.t1 [Chlamydomonas eustigma]